ncbi:hypothetical protein [Methylobacterium nonmethylotrophicum]|uniref:Class I SAM-dependent methyltransferase n=1 Tax=Methylobacterium nonmethylotrophicum TaxID=1141884 RepID=A0A4Z0NNA9_9HYPH|nr:hypothetical protein [Methylobacterium nonmethylotrophicum]TGD97944.1 hypothetical protein EU555_17425 [Methylobacterium nonmethylotrophicum]
MSDGQAATAKPPGDAVVVDRRPKGKDPGRTGLRPERRAAARSRRRRAERPRLFLSIAPDQPRTRRKNLPGRCPNGLRDGRAGRPRRSRPPESRRALPRRPGRAGGASGDRPGERPLPARDAARGCGASPRRRLREGSRIHTNRLAETSLSCVRAGVRAVDRDDFIPELHTGKDYKDVLGELSRLVSCRRYLEIGVSGGDNFQAITCLEGIGVDPYFALSCNVAAGKRRIYLYQTSSDKFFAKNKFKLMFSRIDLAFLDGMHLYEFLLRDFMNTEAVCRKDSIIAMHDCLPLNDIMISRDMQQAAVESEALPFRHWWTGDVWKLIPILKKYRPDLELDFLNCYPTGLVVVRGLNPRSRILRRNYTSIISEFDAVPNDLDSIRTLYRDMKLGDAADFLEAIRGARPNRR